MALLLDLFGFISVILHGLAITGLALTVGGIIFLAGLARPFARELGGVGAIIERRVARGIGWSALGLAIIQAIGLTAALAILIDTNGLSLRLAVGADFALAGGLQIAAALVIAVIALGFDRPGITPLLALAIVLVASTILTSHAASRLDLQAPLALADAIHQAAASAWIGGIPYFIMALAVANDGFAYRRVGRRFSQISMVAVGLLFVAGVLLSLVYIGSFEALWGTAYGAMVTTKLALFAMLLWLGGMNYRSVERLRRDPGTSITRLRRFAEAEIGIGITVFFCAASITSLPPARDLTADRVPLAAIIQRLTPVAPGLVSPDHDKLALIELQARIDAESKAGADHAHVTEAFVPGAGVAPPRNAEDIAWSEYNHHWSGILVLAIGVLATLERTGRWAAWAKHWPLIFIGLAAFLVVRSDPEVWPLGSIGFFESFRDPEVAQHRLFSLLIAAFGVFEWAVRTGRLRSRLASLIFPLICASGGMLLLTHSHALNNVREELLIEWTHIPLAIFGVAAGWARWLELRLDPADRRIPGWIWPICLMLVGAILLIYREH